MKNRRTFQSYVRWPRKHFPVRCKRLRVHFGLPPGSSYGTEGLCQWTVDDAGYPVNIDIFISSGLSPSHTVNTIIHEWVHAHRAMNPHIGEVDDERALHAVIERLIGNRWDKLRGYGDGESDG